MENILKLEIIMKNKYYTPEIEEFHVGFEYETSYLQACGTWSREVLEEDYVGYFHSIYSGDAVPTEFRVKYLDKDDIEDLGFKLIKGLSDPWTYRKSVGHNYYFIHQYEDAEGESVVMFGGGDYGNCTFKVKNKTEFIEALKKQNIPT